MLLTGLRIRPLRRVDIPIVCTISDACSDHNERHAAQSLGEAELLRFMEEPRSMGFVAEHEGKIIGFCLANGTLHQDLDGTMQVEIVELVVLHKYRRRGVGTELINRITDHKYVKVTYATVLPNSEISRKLLEKCMFFKYRDGEIGGLNVVVYDKFNLGKTDDA